MAKGVSQNGGQYVADFTPDCTHLIVEISFHCPNFIDPTAYGYGINFDHVHQGKKYEYALKWNIPVVSLAWFAECLKHRGVVDESGGLALNSECLSRKSSS